MLKTMVERRSNERSGEPVAKIVVSKEVLDTRISLLLRYVLNSSQVFLQKVQKNFLSEFIFLILRKTFSISFLAFAVQC